MGLIRPQVFIALKRLFGYGKAGAPTQVNPLKTAGVDPADFPLYASSPWSDVQDIIRDIQDRLQLYSEFESMGADDLIAAVLDVYAEDSTQLNPENNKVVWPSSKNPVIQKILEDLFESIELNDQAFAIVRETAQMGDSFSVPIRGKFPTGNEAGITRICAIKPHIVTRCIDDFHRLSGFVVDSQMPSTSQLKDVRPNIQPWDLIHWRLLGYNRQSEYGRSLLAPARRLWRRLRMMEDALMIYRLKRSPDRFVFAIKNTSGLSPEQRFRVLRKMRDDLRNKRVIDKEGGTMRGEVDPWSIDEDFYIDEEAMTISRLEGSNQQNPILDVDYTRKRLYGALKVPPDYFGFSEAKGGLLSQSTLSDQDIQFARQCKRLQHAFMLGVMRLCQIHLTLLNIDTDIPENEFSVNMVPVSYLEEMQRANVFKIRAETISVLKQVGSELELDQEKWFEYILVASGFPAYVIDRVQSTTGVGLQGTVPVHDRAGRVLTEKEIDALKEIAKAHEQEVHDLRERLTRSFIVSHDNPLSEEDRAGIKTKGLKRVIDGSNAGSTEAVPT